MLISKLVEITLVGNNVKYYENLGYSIPKKIDKKGKVKYDLPNKLLVKIEHLPLDSTAKVHVKCDFCGKDIYPVYSLYNRTVKKYKENNIDSCCECRNKKVKLMQETKNKNNMIEKDEHGYWCDKNNLIKEFNNYYKQYGTFAKMYKNKYGVSIINGLQKHNENITSMVLQLGYSIQDLGRVPNGWYNDFDVLKEDIIKLINKYGRFPTLLEIQKYLRIGSLIISHHGGMQEIKNKIDYNQKDNLLDDNNYYNASSLEYMVAQFLIHNTNITYGRNIIISPEDGKFNCDFRAIIDSDDENNYLWIEVWGAYGGNKFKGEYDKTHDIKIEIYKNKNYNLISLYPDDFTNKSYEEIQDMLYEKFKPYMNLKYKYIDSKNFSTYNKKSDYEILQELMTYSIDGFYLPSDTEIQKLNSRLYIEIYKRFGNFGKMADKFNIIDKLKTKPMGYWSEERLLDYFIKIHSKYGTFLTKTQIIKNTEQCNLCKDLYSGIDKTLKYGGKISMQLKCLYNNLNIINNQDIIYLNKIVNKKARKVKQEHQIMAQEILEIYNKNIA